MAQIIVPQTNFNWALQQGIIIPAYNGAPSVYNGFVSLNNALAVDPVSHMDHIPEALHAAMLGLPDQVLYSTSDLGEVIRAIAESNEIRPMDVDTSPHDFYHIMCDESVRIVSRHVLNIEAYRARVGLPTGPHTVNAVAPVESNPAVFHCFGDLPTELQLMIWRTAARTTDKKHINVRVKVAPSRFHGDEQDEETLNVMVTSARYRGGKVPVLFHVCRNSRQEAMKTLFKFPMTIPEGEDATETERKQIFWKHTDTMIIEDIEYSATA